MVPCTSTCGVARQLRLVPAAAWGKRTGRPDLLFLFFESFSALDFLHMCACVCEAGGGGLHFNQPVVFPESLVRLDLSLGISWVFCGVARACGSLCMGVSTGMRQDVSNIARRHLVDLESLVFH
ncbi:unnamed protein product [Ectocarpus sp. 12 AP-2014]